MEKLFLKPVIAAIDDLDNFGQKKNEKEKTYILQSIRKTVSDFENKVAKIFKTNTLDHYDKQTVESRKIPIKLKVQKQSEYN